MCTKDSLFVVNGVLYKQVDGVAMGSPLGPAFANNFMCYNEERWLNNCPISFKPLSYRRYVDDTFIVFKEKNHALLFLSCLNNRHINMNFTIDTEKDSKLTFVDIMTTKENDKFVHSIYRKPTFSGLGVSFSGYCHSSFKINAIKALLHRAFHLSS